MLAFAAILCVGAGRWVAPARAADYVPGEVVVGYAPGQAGSSVAHAREMGVRAAPGALPGNSSSSTPSEQIIRVPAGRSVWQVIAKLRRQRGVLYAVPNYIAHTAGWIPNDPGIAHRAQGWELLQWNFLPGVGVDAPDAWSHMFAVHRPGGRGVVIAVLDTGVAYRDWNGSRSRPISRARTSSIRTTSSPATRSRSTARATARSSPG